MKHLAATLIAVLTLSCLGYSQAKPAKPAPPDRRPLLLNAERQKLNRATDPVARTKSNIKISEILLSLIADDAKADSLDAMSKHLDEYVTAIQDSHSAMMKTGRDAHKKPGGFKELEIALRKHMNQLKDIGGTLTYDERPPVEKARETASTLRESLIKALLGNLNAPNNKK